LKCSICGKDVVPPFIRLGGRQGDIVCLDCFNKQRSIPKLDMPPEEAKKEIEERRAKARKFKEELRKQGK